MIGRGGFGQVWLARNRHDRKNWALKVIPKDKSIELKGIREFHARAKANPFLVDIYPVGESSCCYFYPMDLADHVHGNSWDPDTYEPASLQRYLARRGPMPMDELLGLAAGLLKGLAALHAQKGAHCDVKPDKILRFGGVWKLGDPGLLSPTSKLAPGRGTPLFWPPEGTIDETADLYALGKTLYVALTAAPLPRFADFAAGRIRPPQKDARVDALREILVKACADRPARYGSAAEMLSDIERLQGQPASTRRFCTTHATPEDTHYVTPSAAWPWLEACVADPRIKLVAVTGFAGFGKSSLIVTFLKQRTPELDRARDGSFYWNFEEDPSFERMVEAVCAFADANSAAMSSDTPLAKLLSVLRSRVLYLALDGLQVHQRGSQQDLTHAANPLASWPGQGPIGRVTDSRLRQLLTEACLGNCSSTVIVASRYHLPDVHRWLNTSCRELDAARLSLTESEAAQVLRSCSGHPLSGEDCQQFWRRWAGHPFGLRMSADVIQRLNGIPIDYLGLDSLREAHGRLIEKLIEFYDEQLTQQQRLLLGVLSLFRAPVSAATVDRLARHLWCDPEQLEADTLEDSVQGLQVLSSLSLVIRRGGGKDKEGVYVCHPTLREGIAKSFRLSLPWSGPAQAVLEGPREPGDRQRQATRLMHALISCLLDVGEYARADEIVRNHLDDGWLFVQAGEVQDGALCLAEFVQSDDRQRACEQLLSEARLIHYLRMTGLLLLLTGNVKEAARMHEVVARRANSREAIQALLNQVLLCSMTGELELAENLARTTLQLTEELGDGESRRHALCCLAHVHSLRGWFSKADKLYEQAANQNGAAGSQSGSETLRDTDAILYGWHLLRCDRAEAARRALLAELRRSSRSGPPGIGNVHQGYCRAILAAAHVRLGDVERGLKQIAKAEATFRSQQCLLGLCDALLTRAEAHRQAGEFEDARQICGEAASLAAERELSMAHGGALLVQARIGLDELRAEMCCPLEERDEAGDDDEYESMYLTLRLCEVRAAAGQAPHVAAGYWEICREAQRIQDEADAGMHTGSP